MQAAADIICLQEVEIERQAEITDFMRARGYDYVIQDRTGSKFTIGNITFFRSNKLCCTWHDDRSRVLITAFKLLADVHGDKGSTAEADKLVASARRTHAQVDTAESAATETAAPNVDAGDAVGAGDETGVGEAAEILVANCHLEGNPWKAQARFNQIRKAVAHMQRHIEAERRPVDDARILIAGDFNCTRAEGIYRYLYRGRLEGGYWEPFQRKQPVVAETAAHAFTLHDVYKDCAAFAQPYTFGRPGGGVVIDFLWASAALPVRGVLQFVGPRRALDWQRRGIPNAEHPSDHLPLGAVVDVALAAPRRALSDDAGDVAAGDVHAV